MTSIVPGRRPDSERYATLPLPQVFSDYTPTSGIRFLALVLALKSNHSSFGGDVVWPVLTQDEICTYLHRSKPTMQRIIEELKKLGLLKVTRMKHGCLYEVVFKEFEGDSYRGKPGPITPDSSALVSMDVITSGISDGAFHLILMLDCTKKNHASVKYVSQGKLRTYFKSPRPDLKKDNSDPYVSVRQIQTWLQELENLGIIERIQNGHGEVNEYIIHKKDSVIAGVSPSLSKAGPTEEVEKLDGHRFERDLEHPDRDGEDEELGSRDDGWLVYGSATAYGRLAKHFERVIKDMSLTWGTKIRAGDILIPPLAKTFKRWLASGVSEDEILEMIDGFPKYVNPNSDVPYWRAFLAYRELLASKVAEWRENDVSMDPDAPGYAGFWKMSPEDLISYETNTVFSPDYDVADKPSLEEIAHRASFDESRETIRDTEYPELAETHIELSPLPEAGNHYAENPLFNPAKRLAMYISR